jgi:hypothetical protein
MCGHVGIAGDLAYKDEQTMKRLLIYDYFRGPDSTGFAGIGHDGNAKIAKIASNPVDLFDMQRFKDALKGPQCSVFIGHNRLATRGNVNNINAHPFQFDHIIGAHNGTLETRDKWALEDALGEKFDVDSQALFAGIAKLGVENVIPMLHSGELSTNSSAYALVWYNQNEGTLNFLRNRHRPLWYGFEKGFKKMFWGSEWEIIDSAVRGGAAYQMYVEDETKYKYWPFDEDVHYRFDVNALKKGGDTRPKPKARELKGKEPVSAGSTGGGSNPFGRQSAGFHRTEASTSTGSGSMTTYRGKSHGTTSKDKKSPDFLHLLGDISSPFAGWISEEKFNEIAKFGCTWCGATVEYGEPGLTIYDRDDMVLCPGCSGHSPEETDPAIRVYVKGSQIDAYA